MKEYTGATRTQMPQRRTMQGGWEARTTTLQRAEGLLHFTFTDECHLVAQAMRGLLQSPSEACRLQEVHAQQECTVGSIQYRRVMRGGTPLATKWCWCFHLPIFGVHPHH